MNRRLGVLISGRGSNLKAIIDAIEEKRLDASIAIVISNHADAPGLDHARQAGIQTLVIGHKSFATREDYDRALVKALNERQVGLVCLAGFMRRLSPVFIDAFPDRILNIHPSLLPLHKGTDTHRRALLAGDLVSGCTVHVVTPELDDGPAVARSEVRIQARDTPETLEQRVLAEEHRLYPAALEAYAMALREGLVDVAPLPIGSSQALPDK